MDTVVSGFAFSLWCLRGCKSLRVFYVWLFGCGLVFCSNDVVVCYNVRLLVVCVDTFYMLLLRCFVA